MVLLEKLKDEIEIVPTNKDQVQSFILKHYLNTWPAGIKAIYGIRKKSTGEMIGMVIYGVPFHSAVNVAKPEIHTSNEALELKRLYIEDAPDLSNIESYVISQTLKMVKQQFPEVKVVITFADEKVGHLGTVYQATNAIYLGKSSGKHKYVYILRGNLKNLHGLLDKKSYPKN